MNKKAQIDIQQIIAIIFFIIVFVPVIYTITSLIRSDQCNEYQKEINSLNNQINQLKAQLQETTSSAQFWKDKYENLTNTEITKEDFVEIKADVNLLLNKINNTNNQIYNINQQIINIKHIRNIYFALSFALSFSFSLFGFALIDFAFFKFEISRKIIKKIYNLRNRNI